MRKTIGEYAKEYLISQGFNKVGYGDSGLLHEIADYANAKCAHNMWHTEVAILNALDRSPLFEKKYFIAGFRQQVLCRYFKIKGDE